MSGSQELGTARLKAASVLANLLPALTHCKPDFNYRITGYYSFFSTVTSILPLPSFWLSLSDFSNAVPQLEKPRIPVPGAGVWWWGSSAGLGSGSGVNTPGEWPQLLQQSNLKGWSHLPEGLAGLWMQKGVMVALVQSILTMVSPISSPMTTFSILSWSILCVNKSPKVSAQHLQLRFSRGKTCWVFLWWITLKEGRFKLDLMKKSLLREWWGPGTGCSEKLWLPHPLKCPRLHEA